MASLERVVMQSLFIKTDFKQALHTYSTGYLGYEKCTHKVRCVSDNLAGTNNHES